MHYLDYNSETRQNWRKEVEDYLGFKLQIPEYAEVRFTAEEYQSPVWDYFCWFYDSQDGLLCRLKSHDESIFEDKDTCIPGVPDTWGSDADWINRFLSYDYAPVFKGFPWNFSLVFFDQLERPLTEIVARRTFQNDSQPMIHMAWYLSKWTYDASGNSDCSRSWKYCDWEIPL